MHALTHQVCLSCIHMHTPTQTHAYTCEHLLYTHTDVCTHTHMHTHIHTDIHMGTYIHTHIDTHTHTRIHTHTHTYTHTLMALTFIHT